jgi:hypothetical protein
MRRPPKYALRAGADEQSPSGAPSLGSMCLRAFPSWAMPWRHCLLHASLSLPSPVLSVLAFPGSLAAEKLNAFCPRSIYRTRTTSFTVAFPIIHSLRLGENPAAVSPLSLPASHASEVRLRAGLMCAIEEQEEINGGESRADRLTRSDGSCKNCTRECVCTRARRSERSACLTSPSCLRALRETTAISSSKEHLNRQPSNHVWSV